MVLDLGELHLSGFPLPDEKDPIKSPLRLVHCQSCNLLQLRDVVNPDLMYRTYWYRSGTNQTMRDALRDVTASVEEIVGLKSGDVVVDIGANDNTLLRSYSVNGLHRIAFEPSNIGREAQPGEPEVKLYNDYFCTVPELEGQARVVTSIAMFYDVEDPHTFIRDVKATLAPDGVWVLQVAYLPAMLARNAFDGICHEHLAYYSLQSLEPLLAQHGLAAFDAIPIALNEGSIRLYVSAADRKPSERLLQLREEEARLGLDTLKPYREFGERVAKIKNQVLSFIEEQRANGANLHGYGASTKGNTLLQYFGIDSTSMDAIWERQPQKCGRETAGTRIPIISEAEGRSARPELLMMLPWHFAEEFVSREQAYMDAGGQFVIALPEFRVLKSISRQT